MGIVTLDQMSLQIVQMSLEPNQTMKLLVVGLTDIVLGVAARYLPSDNQLSVLTEYTEYKEGSEPHRIRISLKEHVSHKIFGRFRIRWLRKKDKSRLALRYYGGRWLKVDIFGRNFPTEVLLNKLIFYLSCRPEFKITAILYTIIFSEKRNQGQDGLVRLKRQCVRIGSAPQTVKYIS